jgi:hypothetical protein
LATFLWEDFAGRSGRHDMQISALHTIIAAQQARTAAPARPAPPTEAAKSSQPSAFAPLDFSEAQIPDTTSATAPAYSANAPLGSQVDIRV